MDAAHERPEQEGSRHGGALRDAVRDAQRRLAAEGIDEPELNARILMMHATGLSATEMVTHGGVRLTESQQALFASLLLRRLGGEPVGRILGQRDFWGLTFALSPGTLEPRPDSEMIVEEALALSKQLERPVRDILDLGSGSGCLLIALLVELPQARGHGVDLSLDAVETARGNAARNNVAERCLFTQGSWGEGLDRQFDLIVSNPPYIASSDMASLQREVREHDPGLALDGGPDGLAPYRLIVPDLQRLLAPGGAAVLEIGAGQEQPTRMLAGQHGFSTVSTRRDLGGHVRAIGLRR